MNIPAPFKHQEATSDFIVTHPEALVANDPGTGKTRSVLDAFTELLRINQARRMLVFAPLSILESAWADDIEKFTPGLRWAIAHGKTIKTAWDTDADVIITNHDTIKWLAKQGSSGRRMIKTCDMLVIDESTAFKNRASQRSRAMLAASRYFPRKVLMTGTLIPTTVLDIWHQALILDGGQRLGNQFFKFRSQMCEPVQTGPRAEHVQWRDKPNAVDDVTMALSDITIRYRFEDCIDIPENTKTTHYVTMPASVMKQYHQLEELSRLETQEGDVIDAVHAAARVNKMLQVLSGAVYDTNGEIVKVHSHRAALVAQLVDEREHSLVAFNWTHQRDLICKELEKRRISYAIIDGTVRDMAQRKKIVDAYQRGEYRTLLCHPQSAGHGLTLTRGTATIWASPTSLPEHFQQFNRRIYRTGQTKATETICIAARDTREEQVYEVLDSRMERMTDTLGIFAGLTQATIAA